MARLLSPLKRRQLAYGGKASPEELSAWGRTYLEEGRFSDALEFFAAARDMDGLGKIARGAIDEGDAFFLWEVQRSAPDLVSTADWKNLARRAEALGKHAFAERARAGGAPPPPPFAREAEPSEGAEDAAPEQEN